jgi:hypothetical protein
LYAAIIALCSFVVIFAGIFYIKVIAKDETTPVIWRCQKQSSTLMGK